MNLYNDNGTYINCVTDVCGLDAEITWTANFTGYVRVQTNEYVNGSNQCSSNSISSDLFYRKTSGGGSCVDQFEPKNSCSSSTLVFANA